MSEGERVSETRTKQGDLGGLQPTNGAKKLFRYPLNYSIFWFFLSLVLSFLLRKLILPDL